jgi:hypothetical protein
MGYKAPRQAKTTLSKEQRDRVDELLKRLGDEQKKSEEEEKIQDLEEK